MYEQDYIMRKISNIIKFLKTIIFGEDSSNYELSKNQENKQSDNLHKILIELIAFGKVNEAENLLFENFDSKDNRQVLLALDFYERLNKLDDDFLQQNNFSKEEIEDGLKEIARKVGIPIYKP